MYPVDRSSRSSLIFSAGNQLLHAETVQSPQEFGGLQQDDFWLYNKLQGKIISDKFVVVGKVRHSQGMTEAPLPVWIIASKEGMIISAHCLGCKARLAESCSHVASVLFYVEAWTRINGKLACTQVKCM